MAAVPILALAWAVVAGTSAPKQPGLNDAKGFLMAYFSEAPTYPEQSWQRLTSRYQKYGPPNGKIDLTQYGHDFSKFSSIDVTNVGLSRDHDGWFDATITYHWKNGHPPSPSHQQFNLICPGYTKYPFRSCTVENLLLDSAVFYPKRYWDD